MIGVLFWAKIFFAFTPVGQVIKLTTVGMNATTAFMNEIELDEMKDQQKKGINPVEEKFAEEIHGTTEPFFPARVVLEDLPGGFENAVGHEVCGEVLWKLSEWNDFWIWVRLLLHNSHSQEIQPIGRDGLWLVAVGRERWADEDLRSQAFATSEKYRGIWEMRGMWKEKSST